MNDTFFDSLDELYHRAKFGEDVQRAPAVCENRVFDCLYVCFFVTLRGRRAVRSTVTNYEQVLCRGLLVDFDIVCIVFFTTDCPFKCSR